MDLTVVDSLEVASKIWAVYDALVDEGKKSYSDWMNPEK